MLIRLLIRLRWPAAVLAVLLSAATLATFWFRADATIGGHVPMLGWRPEVETVAGGVRIFCWADEVANHGSNFSVDTPDNYYPYESFWVWWFARYDYGAFWEIWAPLWPFALATAALALAAFWLKRKQSNPGQCARCRYPLNGASQCPECGRATPPN